MKTFLIILSGFTLMVALSAGEVKPRSIGLTAMLKDAKKQVYINEIAIRAASLKKPSWIELWNNTGADLNLKGYTLQSMTGSELIKDDLRIKTGGFGLILIYPRKAPRSHGDLKADLVIEKSTLFKAMFEFSDIEARIPLRQREYLRKRFPDPKEYRTYLFRDTATDMLLANELALISPAQAVESYCIWNTEAFRPMKPHPSRVKSDVREQVKVPQFGHGAGPDEVRVLLTKSNRYDYIIPKLSEEDTPGTDLFLPAAPPELELHPRRWKVQAKDGHIGLYDSMSRWLYGDFKCRLAYDRQMRQDVLMTKRRSAVDRDMSLPYFTIVDWKYLSGRTLFTQAGYVNPSFGDIWSAPAELKFSVFRPGSVVHSLASFDKEDVEALDEWAGVCGVPIYGSSRYVRINHHQKSDNRAILKQIRRVRNFEEKIAKLDVVGYSLRCSDDYSKVEITLDSNLARKLTDLNVFSSVTLTGTLDLRWSTIKDLSPLTGQNGITLHLPKTADLTTLKNVKLNGLHLHGTAVPKGYRLLKNGVTVKGITLDKVSSDNLNLAEGQTKLLDVGIIGDVKDLKVLKGMKLEGFSLKSVYNTDLRQLENLDVLKGMKLKRFSLSVGQTYDLSFLADMPLTRLSLHGSRNGKWMREIKLPAKRKTLTHLELRGNGQVKSLEDFAGWKLEYLNLRSCYNLSTQLDELAGMPLKELNLTDCKKIKLADLEMLEGIPLKRLFLEGCHVTDVSALLKLQDLEEITLPDDCKNIEVLVKHPGLKKINSKSPRSFWTEYLGSGSVLLKQLK